MPGEKDKDKDKTDDNQEIPKEEDVQISQIVDQLQISYPDIPRGVIYEATMCITDEHFLGNYLTEQQARHSHTDSEMTVGDLFFSNDPRELNSVIELSAKMGLSKPLTIIAAGALATAKMLYNVVADDDIKKKLDDIELNHSKKLLERANALANTSNQSKTDEETKNKKA